MEFNKFILNTDFVYQNNRIIFTSNGLAKVKRKKITGSRIGSLLGINNYQSPFQTWCDMMGFYKTEGEQFFTEAGIIIEPKLKKYVEQRLKLTMQSYEGKLVGFDVFKDNPIFGGMPDGEPLDQSGKLLFDDQHPLLEIKTTSIDEYQWEKRKNELFLVRDANQLPIIKQKFVKIQKWIIDNQVSVPLSYQYQLALYLYLRKASYGLFCIGFLQNENYLEPEKYDPNHAENLVILEEFYLNYDKFEAVIDYARRWYENYVISGISPELSTQDLEWIRFGYPKITN